MEGGGDRELRHKEGGGKGRHRGSRGTSRRQIPKTLSRSGIVFHPEAPPKDGIMSSSITIPRTPLHAIPRQPRPGNGSGQGGGGGWGIEREKRRAEDKGQREREREEGKTGIEGKRMQGGGEGNTAKKGNTAEKREKRVEKGAWERGDG